MITASDFQKWLEVFNVVQGAAPTPPFSFPLIGQYGGTGVANTGKTITIGGNLRTVGAFTSDFTMTANTSVTFPTSGTLATTASASGIVNSGLINQLAYYAGAGTTLSGLATGNDGTLITSAAGLPSISSTLPITVQTNITRLGVVDQNIELTPVVGGTRYIILSSGGAGNTGTLNLQAGGGSAGFGGGLIMYGHSHGSKPGWVTAGISSASGGKFSVNSQGIGGGTDAATIDAAASMVLGATGLFGTFRIPSVTASRGSFNITPVNNIADHNNVLVNAATNALRTWTLPDASGTITVLGNAVTGSGSIVLATSPTLVTPVLGVATGTSLAVTQNLSLGQGGSSWFLGIPTDAGYMRIHGSNAVNQGAGLILFGTTSAAPNTGRLLAAADTVVQWTSAGAAVTGTLSSTGALSAASASFTKVNGTEAANAVTASGGAGRITTSALTTAAGGTYVITWTNSLITAASMISLTVNGGTNTRYTTFLIVPGAGSATLTINNIDLINALNGTILIGYLVV